MSDFESDINESPINSQQQLRCTPVEGSIYSPSSTPRAQSVVHSFQSRGGTPRTQTQVQRHSQPHLSQRITSSFSGTVESRAASVQIDPPVSSDDLYRKHWDKLPDNLKKISMAEPHFTAQNITPREEHVMTMDARSKCFKLLDPHKPVLTHPTHGLTYCFVDKCMTEIPKHIQVSFLDSYFLLIWTQSLRLIHLFDCTGINVVFFSFKWRDYSIFELCSSDERDISST